MAEIKVFNGIRYNESKVGPLEKVTCPPYDIISSEDEIYYQKLHPNNFVRLILGADLEGDGENNNRFTRAAGFLEKWMEDGVLVRDQMPALYIYEQQFEENGCKRVVRGLTCAVRLQDYEDRVILPHENTLAKPKSHLIPLIHEVKANLDSVYGLYADPSGAVDSILAPRLSEAPDMEATDRDGVRHLVWVLTDMEAISQVRAFMSDKQIAIADGHHRYETALAYSKEVKGSVPDSDWVLMTLANVHQKDMTVYPTHRVVGALPERLLDALNGKLDSLFEITKSTRADLLNDMADRGAIGIYRKTGAVTIRLKQDPAGLIDGSETSGRLELNILHKLVLERLLEIDSEMLRNQTHIVYTRSSDEAMSLVDSGDRQLAFLLNHIPVKTVLDIAAAGERMPQKATYFYPKLLSGLVLRKMD